MRIFDALNDVNNVKSTIKYVKQYGGIADCAVCYTVDPKYPEPGFFARLTGKKKPRPVFTDAYFLDKGGTDGSTRRRHDYDQGHVGPDSADARERAGQAAQTARRRTDRFPHPLHAGLRSGIRPERHSGRSRHRRHQLLVLRRRHGCAGHRG